MLMDDLILAPPQIILPPYMVRTGRDYFAGSGLYDNHAVCADCEHAHLIPKSEQITPQPWFDWLWKHDGHSNFIMKSSELTRLADQLARLKHNADAKATYVASAALTITLTGLPTSSDLTVGREATGVSNATNRYLDVLVGAQATTGTGPTTGKQIELHAIGALDDTPTYPDVFDGTDSAETITSTDIKTAICKRIGFTLTNNTSDRAYPLALQGLRPLWGGDALPVAWTVFLTHSTGVNLNATAANHFVKYTQVYVTIA